MATIPTQNAVPSEAPRDLKFNSGKIDEFVTSLEHEYKDRFGRRHLTIEGIKWMFDQLVERFKVDMNQAIIAAGYIPIDSFQQGAEITKRNEILRDEATGEYYRWDGDLPKSVPAGATPESSGEVGVGKWVSVGDASLRGDLSNDGDNFGDSLVAVKQPFAGAVARTQHDKNTDILSVKDFGAIGDGELHPLSERYTTLAEANSVYPFVTDLAQSIDYAGIQAAINAAKNGNMSVYIPAGGYVINSTLVADYALSMHGTGGQGLRDIESTHKSSQVRGSVIHSEVASGPALSIDPGGSFSFGLTLRDFAIWGVTDKCDVGIYMTHVGWMGIVDGVNIQFFPNQALKLGYIQDTYFNNCSFISSGSKDNPAVTCFTDANYVYFSKCHFELTPYMIKFNDCWNFCFDKCHFEVARPVGDGITDDDRYAYESACVDFGTAYRFQFTNNTWIPVDVGYLAGKLGIGRSDVPYFMYGKGAYFSFVNDIWLAPGGSVNIGWFNTDHINFTSCQFIGMTPSKEALHITNRGKVSGCVFAINASSDKDTLYGIYIGEGTFTDNVIGFTDTAEGKRASGALLYGGCHASGNDYPIDDIINIYVDATVSVSGFDGKRPHYIDVIKSGDIDLTKHHPSTNIRISATGVTTGNIWGAQAGRDVIIYTVAEGTTISYKDANVITAGALDVAVERYHSITLKGMTMGGTPLLQQIG